MTAAIVAPLCTACAGYGKVRLPRNQATPRAAEVAPPPDYGSLTPQRTPVGFAWYSCRWCGGGGRP